MPMLHPKGLKMIIVMAVTRSVVLRLPRHGGFLQEVCFEEFRTSNGIVLLHLKGVDAKSLLSQFLCFP
jgi:hypothetical protein